jgi:25S rRNA (adenine2142-N1)-methyltransferase
MKSKHAKRKPIPIVAPPMKSLKRARKVTSAFHKITHAIDQLENRRSRGSDGDKKLEALKAELTALGGREAYQQASVVTTARCSSSKWVTKCLRRRGLLGGKNTQEARKLRVLEVGAINTELLDTKELDVRAIDLLSRHPRVEQLDFFDLAKHETRGGRSPNFDVIVVSMVINCVPTPLDRGRMLVYLKQLLAPRGGILFLTLPRSCLTSPAEAAPGQKAFAAPGFDKASFEALITDPAHGLGFVMHGEPDSKCAEKVVFYCLERTEMAPADKDEMGETAGAEVKVAAKNPAGRSKTVTKAPGSKGSLFSVVLPREGAC